jgi:hypothetical protein
VTASAYIVAKANATALPFVARAEKERAGWIVISRHGTYYGACAALAALRGMVRA